MISFRVRATDAELLDQPAIKSGDLFKNLEELDVINNYLGGHAVTIDGVKYFTNKYKKINSIIDIGCGGGDTLGAIARWCIKNNRNISLTGIDLLPEAISFAKEKYGNLGIKFICSDYNHFNSEYKFDVAINSLICHHLYNTDLTAFIKFNQNISRYGFIINDLHRHPLAYYSISLLTDVFSRSYMVKNDAPLSVRKGFRKKELEDVLHMAGINKFKIEWKWAFRYLVIADHGTI